MPVSISYSYNANARINPPTIASPPLAMFAAAFGVTTGDVAEGVELVGEEPLPVLVEVNVAIVILEEADEKVGTGIVEDEFRVVDVETTVTVEEGTEVVVVLVCAA